MSSQDTEKGNSVKEEVDSEADKKKEQSQKVAKKRKEMEPRSDPNKISEDEQPTDEEDSIKCALTAWSYEPEKLRYALAQMIIVDGLPFAFSEKPGFRKLVSKACPWFPVPSRRTTIRDCVRIYYREKDKLKKFFKESCERVSLSIDTWTSMQQESYMCVTAHFLDTDWKLQKRIIGFFLVSGHKGEDIGKDIEGCLVDWDLEKIFSITVDNESANDGTISYMKMVMNNAKTSIAKGQYIHMRCAAHVINLIVSDCLRELDISVQRVRAAVRFITNSPARITQFERCADLEKVDSKAFLSLDVCTRWNSTYLMLKAAATYEKVFDRYGDDDPYFAIELNSEKASGVPEAVDWEYAKKISEFLEHFYNLSVRVSASNHCTSHIFFHEIAEVYLLLRESCESTDALRKEMAERMMAKYNKYWGDHESFNILIFVAVALDPRYKLSDYTRFATFEMFGEVKGEEVWKKMSETLNDLFKEYGKMYASSEKKKMESNVTQKSEVQGISMRSLIAKRMRQSAPVKDEEDTEQLTKLEEEVLQEMGGLNIASTQD